MRAKAFVSLSSVVVAAVAVGCLNLYEVTIETPIQAKIDVSAFQRVYVAGFVSGGSKAVDTNSETTRLLKSQLRSKSALKVVDIEPVAIAAEVDKRRSSAGEAALPDPSDPNLLKIQTPKDLAIYEPIFNDTNYWKKIGDENQSPLIVTGTIMLAETAKSGVQSTVTPQTDATGRQTYTESRQFVDKKGYTLVPKFVFIDGRTGQQVYSETYNQEVTYPANQNTPPLSSYFEMMDKVLPSFLNTLSTQKIRGTRILMK